MPVKKKMLAEAAKLGMWNSLHRDFVLSMVAKMSLGQSGEVDKWQSTKYTPPESLRHRYQLAQTFFWFDLRRIAHALCCCL
jgi:hypothetical protein